MNRSLVVKTLGAVLAASALVVGGAHAASADSINFVNPNALIGPSTGPTAASLEVSCSLYNHTITAGIAISAQPGSEAGQWVSYQVVVKDLDVNTVTTYNWRGSYNAYYTYSTSGSVTYKTPSAIPGFTFYAPVAGHSYAVWANVAWYNQSRQAWDYSQVGDSQYSVYYWQSGAWRWGTFGRCWT